MSKKQSLFVGIAVALLGCALLGGVAFVQGWRWWDRSQLAYIEKTTGISFPVRVSQIDTFDNGEYFTVAHVKLSEADIPVFTQKNGFFSEAVDVTPWIATLKPENRAIPAGARLRYLAGRSQTNRWVYALEQETGRMWVVVFYPDPGGALP